MNHRVLPIDLIVKSRLAKCTSLFQENVVPHMNNNNIIIIIINNNKGKREEGKKGELWLNYGR